MSKVITLLLHIHINSTFLFIFSRYIASYIGYIIQHHIHFFILHNTLLYVYNKHFIYKLQKVFNIIHIVPTYIYSYNNKTKQLNLKRKKKKNQI